LQAILNLRKDADRQEHGPRAVFSEPQYVSHPATPSAWYLLHAPVEQIRLATLVKASRSRACVYFFLCEEGASEAAFAERARQILDGLEVEE
jgi:hypothetical protein